MNVDLSIILNKIETKKIMPDLILTLEYRPILLCPRGIYIFLIGDKKIYIGASFNLQRRVNRFIGKKYNSKDYDFLKIIAGHFNRKRFHKNLGKKIEIYYFENISASELSQIEQTFINTYKPQFNHPNKKYHA